MILSMFALDVRSAIEPKRVTNGTRTKHGFKSVFNPWLKFLRIVEPGKSDLLYSSRSAVTYCITTERDEYVSLLHRRTRVAMTGTPLPCPGLRAAVAERNRGIGRRAAGRLVVGLIVRLRRADVLPRQRRVRRSGRPTVASSRCSAEWKDRRADDRIASNQWARTALTSLWLRPGRLAAWSCRNQVRPNDRKTSGRRLAVAGFASHCRPAGRATGIRYPAMARARRWPESARPERTATPRPCHFA